MRRTLFLVIFLVTALAMIITGRADAQANGPIETVVDVAAGQHAVGDVIPVTVAVTHPAGYYVVAPRLAAGDQWGDMTVAGLTAPVTSDNGDGSETTTLTIDVQIFQPGAFTTPPLALSVTDGAGGILPVEIAPAAVTIDSLLQEGDTELRDIKAQASLPLPAAWPWIVAGMALAALAGLAIWRLRKQPVAVDNRPPWQKALDGLAAVESANLPAQGQFKEHYTLVSEIMRVYVEQIFGIPALERTTGEIRADIRQSDMSPDVAALFVAFLQESDLIKFSTFTPDVESARNLLAQARAMVEATRPVQQVDDTTASGKPDRRTGQRPAAPAEVMA